MQLEWDKKHYLHVKKSYKRHLPHSKRKILWKQLSQGNKSKTIYNITENLTLHTIYNILQSLASNMGLVDNFANFSAYKINTIRSQLGYKDTHNTPTRKYNILSKFQTITEDEIFWIVKRMKSPTCSNDPCNTRLILKFFQITVPAWTKIINQPFAHRFFF